MNCGRQPGSVAAPPIVKIAAVVRTQTKRHPKPSRIGFKGAICAMMAMLQPCGATPLRDLVESTVSTFGLTQACNVDGIVTQMEAFGAGQISSLPVLLNNPTMHSTLQLSIGEAAVASLMLDRAAAGCKESPPATPVLKELEVARLNGQRDTVSTTPLNAKLLGSCSPT